MKLWLKSLFHLSLNHVHKWVRFSELKVVSGSTALSQLLQEDDVWTISEALDALMDMFSDNDWHQILLDLNLPIVIKDLEKQFKTKVRSQRKELKDRYPAVQTVQTNLSRFAKYIEKEALKYANGTRTN